jgi:hypothetical protein
VRPGLKWEDVITRNLQSQALKPQRIAGEFQLILSENNLWKFLDKVAFTQYFKDNLSLKSGEKHQTFFFS